VGSNTVVNTSSKIGVNSVPANSKSRQASQDTVKLSSAALAKSLKLQGQNPTQIAQLLGINVKTVDSYLGIKSVTPTTGQTTKVIPAEPCWVTDIESSNISSS
jgi:hypothetical protein